MHEGRKQWDKMVAQGDYLAAINLICICLTWRILRQTITGQWGWGTPLICLHTGCYPATRAASHPAMSPCCVTRRNARAAPEQNEDESELVGAGDSSLKFSCACLVGYDALSTFQNFTDKTEEEEKGTNREIFYRVTDRKLRVRQVLLGRRRTLVA